MERLYVVTLLLLLATFSGAQLQSSVERPCPGERVEFTCTVPSVAHDWMVPSLNISRALLRRNKNKVFSDSPFQFTVTEVMTGSITSTATVNVTEDLNGTLVMCRGGFKIHPSQNSTINIIAPPAAPETPVIISNSRQEFIIKWDEPPLNMGRAVDTYFVNISGPSALCGSADTLQKVNARNYTCLIKTEPELQENETVIVRVQAANCGGNLRGPESEPVTVPLKAPLLVPSRPTTAHSTTTHPTATPSISTDPEHVDPTIIDIVIMSFVWLNIVLGITVALSLFIYERYCRTDKSNTEKDSMYSMVRRILILVFLCLTVVGIPIAICMILCHFCKTGGKVEDVKPKNKTPASFMDQWEEHPVTGDICTTPTKRKKIHMPEDHLPTSRPSISTPPDTTGKAPDTSGRAPETEAPAVKTAAIKLL